MKHLESINERVETGAVQFGNDWPGVYIRGDNALYLATCLESVIDLIDQENSQVFDVIAIQALINLKKILEGCRV